MLHETLSVANFVTHLIRLSLKFEKYKDKNVSEELLLKFRNCLYQFLQDHWKENYYFCLDSDERFENPICINCNSTVRFDLFHKTIVRACKECDLSVDFLTEILPPIKFFLEPLKVQYKLGWREKYLFSGGKSWYPSICNFTGSKELPVEVCCNFGSVLDCPYHSIENLQL